MSGTMYELCKVYKQEIDCNSPLDLTDPTYNFIKSLDLY